MNIEEMIRTSNQYGLSVDTRELLKKMRSNIVASNVGVFAFRTIEDENRAILELTKNAKGSSMIDLGDLCQGTTEPWIEYRSFMNEEAQQYFTTVAQGIYSNNDALSLCLVRKAFGAKARAIYQLGKLVDVNLCYDNFVGISLLREDTTIRDIPKNIDYISDKPITVYGTLTLNVDELEPSRPGLEHSLSDIIVEDLLKENYSRLIFRAEYIEKYKDTSMSLSADLVKMEEMGFKSCGYRVVNCDIYDYEEYFGDKVIDQFDYGDGIQTDSILVMIDSEQDLREATATMGINLLEKLVAIRVGSSSDAIYVDATVKKLRLDNIDGEIHVIAEVEPVKVSDDFIIEEFEASVDDAYDIDLDNKVKLRICNGDVELVKERE